MQGLTLPVCAGDVLPEGSLALSKCSFEYAEAPELRLLESASASLMGMFSRGRHAFSALLEHCTRQGLTRNVMQDAALQGAQRGRLLRVGNQPQGDHRI